MTLGEKAIEVADAIRMENNARFVQLQFDIIAEHGIHDWRTVLDMAYALISKDQL